MVAPTYNLADLFEQAVDEWPDRLCVADERRRLTFAELDARANRLAHHLSEQGVSPGDHVGIYGRNRVEWVEAMWAVFKLRAVWININFRYVAEELEYLFDQAGLVYLIVEDEFVENARVVAPDLPRLTFGDNYEAALNDQSPDRDFAERSNDDLYVLFTGGTTGMPKGVVWRHEDVVMALGGGIDVRSGERVKAPSDFITKGNTGGHYTMYPLPPLMHGAAQWAVMGQGIQGKSNIVRANFDPLEVWRTIETESVNLIMITGDAMARPLAQAKRGDASSCDASSLFAISSSAVTFSQAAKDDMYDLLPDIIISDSIGSSESGGTGISVSEKGQPMKGGPTVNPIGGACVVDDELRPVSVGTVGQLVRPGNIPLGYLNDPEKTAATFVVGPDGIRYALTGDRAVEEPDGTITLLGRGSTSINSGGEKIFPEEVESALKAHRNVADAVVVGVPDERWGQLITAVVSFRDGTSTLESLQETCRERIAGYKLPRRLTVVDTIVRSPAGKTDYPWATQVALDDLEASPS